MIGSKRFDLFIIHPYFEPIGTDGKFGSAYIVLILLLNNTSEFFRVFGLTKIPLFIFRPLFLKIFCFKKKKLKVLGLHNYVILKDFPREREKEKKKNRQKLED